MYFCEIDKDQSNENNEGLFIQNLDKKCSQVSWQRRKGRQEVENLMVQSREASGVLSGGCGLRKLEDGLNQQGDLLGAVKDTYLGFSG